jgi:hypothetical protein
VKVPVRLPVNLVRKREENPYPERKQENLNILVIEILLLRKIVPL